MVSLVHTCDREPGIRRKGAGRGFYYVDNDGEKVTRPEVLERIQGLAIPPAYREVWICQIENGHLQATGRDVRERKQYRYHAAWHEMQKREKFDRLKQIGHGLPKLRRKIRRILKDPADEREMVTAAALRLIDRLGYRVGNESYLQENGTRGISTLAGKNVSLDGSSNRISISYTGKGGRTVEADFSDRLLAEALEDCHELPGQRLFTYEISGNVCALDSGHINDFLRESYDDAVTAKDLRTWRASAAAAEFLGSIRSPEDRDAEVRDAVRHAASLIKNRYETCLKHYVHPGIGETYQNSGRWGFSRKRPKAIAEMKESEVLLLSILDDL